MTKIVNQGTVSWLVTQDDNRMVNWVLKGKYPDSTEFVLGRGFVGKVSDANVSIANEAVAFIMKNRGSR